MVTNDGKLSLPKTVKGAIIAPKMPEFGECRLSCESEQRGDPEAKPPEYDECRGIKEATIPARRIELASSVICARAALVIGAVAVCLGATGDTAKAADSTPFTVPAWSDLAGWNNASCYSTIQTADIDNDGRDELIGRCAFGVRIYRFDDAVGAWLAMPHGPGWTNAWGWEHPQYYETIFSGDLDGDGSAELMARAADGLVAFSYDASAKTWQPLPRAGAWPDFSDTGSWDRSEYYKTIQAADLDGDGTDEVIARGSGGIVAYSYDASAKTWSKLAAGPVWSDEGGWNKPQYYETIHSGDLDGDGAAELFARDGAGIVAYSYDAAARIWQPLPRAGAWPDFSDSGGWDRSEYYKTIQAADLDGNGTDEVIARGSGGIVAYRYDASLQTWSRLAGGPGWSDEGGWNKPQYYETIHSGDLSGDGAAEVFARGAGGVGAYSYDSNTNTWSRFPHVLLWSDDAGWDSADYYLTIQAAKVAKKHSKIPAVLIGRFKRGIVTARYDPGTQAWGKASLPYPPFSGEELAAYNAIQRGMGLSQPIRDFYGTASASQLDQYNSSTRGVPSLKRPSDISPEPWSRVVRQIETELTWASAVAGAFANNETLINQVFLSDDLTLSYVSGLLNIDSHSGDDATVTFGYMFGAVVEAMGAGLDTATAEVITTLAAAAIEAGIEDGMPDGTVTEKYVELVGDLELDFQLAITGNTSNRTDVAADYGLLSTVGNMLWSGTWSYANMATGQAYGRKQYAIFLWQTLAPLAWKWENNSVCFKYSYQPTGDRIPPQALYVKGTFTATCAPTSQLDLLFKATSASCLRTFTTRCSMGLTPEEVYNAWPGSEK